MCITSRYINPFTDYGFKKLFGEEGSKPQLISFINAFLELDNKPKIIDLEFKNLEKLGLSKRDRKTIFDIYCINEEGKHILVELQRAEQTYFKDRMVYYSSILIQEQGLKGLHFDGKALNRNGDLRKVGWDYRLDEVFYNKLNYVFVEMPKFTKSENELNTYLDKWFYFLNNLDALEQIPEIFNDDKDIKNAFKKAEFINMTKEEQSVYLASLKEYRDWYAVLSTAEDKGYAKAKDELERIKKEKWKVEKEKEKVQKEKEKAEREKEKALKREEKALQKTQKAILKFYKLGVSIKELSEDFEMSENEVKKIIKTN